ncbi:protein PTCD3 homolog, mitochondrial [Copidosoma floridanum]|uniref:protein PTCD3 homolog, mitochondrial n=1 Tax=Copidosoma floridanum TaxID=29053 RepID=UPI0006C9A715|nr:protein PTCD3 homolog, mitochondrial [Copidosoma floridanum]
MNSLRAKIVDRKTFRNVVLQLQSLSTTSAEISDEVQIPARKERGPTDILHALESTLSRDPTAPDYKYIDDPYLIPSSLSKKRVYSLAKESGKRAAKWILQEHADLLKSKLSEPLVYAFLPPDKYENKSQVSEEILVKMIKLGNVPNTLHVYNLLNGNVSQETKQAILELLCFYNSSEEQKSSDFPEEASYQVDAPITKNTWTNNPEVEKLFGELCQDETTAPGAYNALICGTSKYLKVDKAWSLYNECVQKRIPLATSTYNHVITLVPVLKDNNEDRKILLTSLLQAMTKNGVKPNIGTLNAVLKSLSTFTVQLMAKEFSLSLLAEFKSININPSLASYYYLLLIFCRPTGTPSNILLEILDELEKREELKIEDPSDTSFFVNAMEVASKHMFNLNAGDRLHKLLMTKDNYKLLGGRLNESVYYRNYLQLLLQSESIDQFMKVYNYLVPHVYIPEPALMRDILEMLEVNDKNKAMELLPQFSSQVVMFDMLDRHQIMKFLFKLMKHVCCPPEGSPLHELYAQSVWTFWTYQKEVSQKRLQRTMWPANVYGSAAVLLVRGNEFEKMLNILEYLVKSQDSVMGAIDPKDLLEIFTACIERGHVPGVLACVEYANDFGLMDTGSMSRAIKNNIPLSESQEKRLIELVGEELSSAKATQRT